MRIMATVSPMRLGGFRQAFLGLGVKPPYRLDSEQLLAIDEVTYAMSGVGLNGADYLIEIIADNDEDLWRVVDESIRPIARRGTDLVGVHRQCGEGVVLA